MLGKVSIACTAMALSVALSAPAVAKECKTETVTEEGSASVTRSLGAYPSSLWAWRSKVKGSVGDGWHDWRRAENRKIECEQRNLSEGKRWICTRTARPCRRSGSAGSGPDCSKITRTLSRYDSGDDVKILQELLVERGDSGITIDGDFGRGTRAAVRSFQDDEGIRPDGVVGPVTLERLCG